MGYVKDTLQSLIREIVDSEDLDLEVDPCVVIFFLIPPLYDV